jgi:hypothetical protein
VNGKDGSEENQYRESAKYAGAARSPEMAPVARLTE